MRMHRRQRDRRRAHTRRYRRTRLNPWRSTVEWRQDRRLHALVRFARRTIHLRWSPRLMQLLLDELIVGDELESLIGQPRKLRMNRYPQAVAVALALRHSFREDMLRA